MIATGISKNHLSRASGEESARCSARGFLRFGFVVQIADCFLVSKLGHVARERSSRAALPTRRAREKSRLLRRVAVAPCFLDKKSCPHNDAPAARAGFPFRVRARARRSGAVLPLSNTHI
jgi:hypothetical protein